MWNVYNLLLYVFVFVCLWVLIIHTTHTILGRTATNTKILCERCVHLVMRHGLNVGVVAVESTP